MQCVVSPFVSGAKSTAYIRSYVGALSSATLSASLAGFLQAPSVKTQKHTNLEALNCHRSNIYILCFPLITSSFLFVFPRRADRFLTDLSETNFFMLSASVQKPDLIKMLFQQSRFLKKKTFIIF